jgi:hypothetical protein
MQVLFEFTGASALVMNNARGIDKLDPLSKLIAEITAKSPRTEADDAEISRLEWHRCLYHASGIGLYVPNANVMRCLRDAGNLVEKNKGGKRIERGLMLARDQIPLRYDGSTDLDELYRDDTHRWRGPARIQSTRVMKTWPIFPSWSFTFEAEMSEEQINLDQLARIATYAGQYVGLCDDRKHGRGRFQASVVGDRTRADRLMSGSIDGKAKVVVRAGT